MANVVAQEFEAANKSYAESFTKGSLPLPPARYEHSPYPSWMVILRVAYNYSNFIIGR